MKTRAIALILAAATGIAFSGPAAALPSVQQAGVKKAYTQVTFLHERDKKKAEKKIAKKKHEAKKKHAAKHKHASKHKHAAKGKPSKHKHAAKKLLDKKPKPS